MPNPYIPRSAGVTTTALLKSATDGDNRLAMYIATTTTSQLRHQLVQSEHATEIPLLATAMDALVTAPLPAVALVPEAAAAAAMQIPAVVVTLLPSAAPMPVVAVAVRLPTAMVVTRAMGVMSATVVAAADVAAAEESRTVSLGNGGAPSYTRKLLMSDAPPFNTRKLLSDAVLDGGANLTVTVTPATLEAASTGTLTIAAPNANTVNAFTTCV